MGAHASGVLITASCRNLPFGRMPNGAPRMGALPGSLALLGDDKKIGVYLCQSVAKEEV